MEIVTSRISVYEIELDLSDWEYATSDQTPLFYQNLSQTIPSVKNHKCMSGKTGGFLEEVRNGTDFAHVIEHVILELISLSHPGDEPYTGWTKKLETFSFLVHYNAPDFLTARIVALLSVEIVKKLIKNQSVNINVYIDILKNPFQYFSQEEYFSENFKIAKPPSVREDHVTSREDILCIEISETQKEHITTILEHIKKHINYIVDSWRNAFIDYCGQFGRSIIGKMELINIDKFIDLIINQDYIRFFRSIRNISQFLYSYKIPDHFITHSIWLYKNRLLTYIMEEYKDEREILNHAIKDFESFFQTVLFNVSEGFTQAEQNNFFREYKELREFRELKEGQGYVLIIDDDRVVRQASRDFMEYHGFKVILAEDGKQGLEILIENKEEISTVILDLVLPDVSGPKVFSTIRSIDSKMRVLVISGYPMDNETQKLFNEGPVAFIQKPFKAGELVKKVQDLSDSETSNI